MPAVQKAVIGAVAPNEIGRASGAFSMLRQLGGVFGIAILVPVFAGAGSFASAQAFSNGFAPALGAAAALSLATATAALALPRMRTTTETRPSARSPHSRLTTETPVVTELREIGLFRLFGG